MSRERLAAAYDALAEASAQVAHELRGNEQPEQERAPRPAPAPAPASGTYDDTQCPSHHRDWKDGNFGPFCTAKSDDPAWSNRNGYCTITPKSAPKWLEIHQPAKTMDEAEVPF